MRFLCGLAKSGMAMVRYAGFRSWCWWSHIFTAWLEFLEGVLAQQKQPWMHGGGFVLWKPRLLPSLGKPALRCS